MLTYEDVVNAPLDKLKTAVDDWSDMAAKLKTLAEEARNGMKAHADAADWAGVNAGVTQRFIGRTAKEFEDAAAEAKGVHAVLADGYASFKRAKDGLQKIIDGSEQAGIVIDPQGKVSARYSLSGDYAARHDPDFSVALKRQNDSVAEWQNQVKVLVDECGDADESLRLALAANVPDGNDFTAPKFSTLDAEQVDRALQLAAQVTGDGGTARNPEALRQLEELMKANAKDPEFATDFYRRMGAEGTLKFSTKLFLATTGLGPAGKDRADLVQHIQGDMGSMLGIATDPRTPGHLDGAWTTALMRAGRKPVDVAGFAGVTTKVYGYQALGALLRHGEYDKSFLVPVGLDMVGMDHKDPDVWHRNMPLTQPMAFNLDQDGGRGFDPMTGLMQAMSNNPEAATAFFNEPVREDSDGNGIVTADDRPVKGAQGQARGMVDYALDRKPEADWYDGAPGGDPTASPLQKATGNALEAAVTGRVPGEENAKPVEHTEQMAKVMERVVAKVGADPSLLLGEDDAPGTLEGMAGNFGNMAAEYMPDLQAAAENGAGQAKFGGVQAHFGKGEMTHFLGAVAQDPDAYGAISNAQRTYTTLLVRDVFAHPENHGVDVGAAVSNAVHPGGEIAGIMAQARVQAVFEEHSAADEQFNEAVQEKADWVTRIIDSVGGKYIEMLPVGGDAVEWLKEDITQSIVDGAQQDSSAEAGQEASDAYSKAEARAKQSAADAVGDAGKSAGLPLRDIREYQGVASSETSDAFSDGRNHTATAAGGGA
ncbi:DUF6571 family protein [Streptomyces sp. NPDC059070]|uniref:DUF6571 family protein n=1 Tax=Streptomyces sp. NPDC059070 TaxID=3346713 RepID=UPI00367B43F3